MAWKQLVNYVATSGTTSLEDWSGYTQVGVPLTSLMDGDCSGTMSKDQLSTNWAGGTMKWTHIPQTDHTTLGAGTHQVLVQFQNWAYTLGLHSDGRSMHLQEQGGFQGFAAVSGGGTYPISRNWSGLETNANHLGAWVGPGKTQKFMDACQNVNNGTDNWGTSQSGEWETQAFLKYSLK